MARNKQRRPVLTFLLKLLPRRSSRLGQKQPTRKKKKTTQLHAQISSRICQSDHVGYVAQSVTTLITIQKPTVHPAENNTH